MFFCASVLAPILSGYFIFCHWQWQVTPSFSSQANSAFHPSTVGECSNPCNYMDYGGGDHQTADQGCVWLLGCRSKSWVRSWTVA